MEQQTTIFEYIDLLEDKNKKLNEMNTKNYNNYCDAIKRINDAIEYMDRRDLDWGSEEHKTLMKILKGEE